MDKIQNNFSLTALHSAFIKYYLNKLDQIIYHFFSSQAEENIIGKPSVDDNIMEFFDKKIRINIL